MNITDYIQDQQRRAALAVALGTSEQYLWQMATGWRGRRFSAQHVLKVCHFSGGLITPHALRPDIYPDPDWLPALGHKSLTDPEAKAA